MNSYGNHRQSYDSRGFELIKPFIHGCKGGQQGLIELISEEKKEVIKSEPGKGNETCPFP